MHRVTARPALLAAAFASALVLGGCAREIGGNVYDGPTVGEAARTYVSTIKSARIVEVQEGTFLEDNRVGQIVGGVAGGVIGSAVGEGLGKTAAIATGALAGAAVGSLIEEEAKRQPAMEYVVADDSGGLITVVQGLEPSLVTGQRVYVQESGSGRTRIVPAP